MPVYFLAFWGVLILIKLKGFFLTRGSDSDFTLILHWFNISASGDINPDLHRQERRAATNYSDTSIDRVTTECEKSTQAKYFRYIVENDK